MLPLNPYTCFPFDYPIKIHNRITDCLVYDKDFAKVLEAPTFLKLYLNLMVFGNHKKDVLASHISLHRETVMFIPSRRLHC